MFLIPGCCSAPTPGTCRSPSGSFSCRAAEDVKLCLGYIGFLFLANQYRSSCLHMQGGYITSDKSALRQGSIFTNHFPGFCKFESKHTSDWLNRVA